MRRRLQDNFHPRAKTSMLAISEPREVAPFERSSLTQILWAMALLLLVDRPGWAEPPQIPKGFAVVELFTSEGCSSCPPADRLLSEIRLTAEKSRDAVYVLSYHVEYWNRLGWDDPYGMPGATNRQNAYRRHFQNDQVYTPQMIVNGQVEFVGSDRKRAQAEIQNGLQSTRNLPLTAKAILSGDHVELTTVLEEPPADCDLIAVLVQREGTQQVKAGENSGRQLKHVNIARALYSARLADDTQQRAKIALPKGLKPEEAEIVVFLQRMGGNILGVTRCAIESKRR